MTTGQKVRVLTKCFIGPRLYYLYQRFREERPLRMYTLDPVDVIEYAQVRSSVEKWSEVIIDGYGWLFTFMQYLSPIFVYHLYKHGPDTLVTISRGLAVPVCMILLAAIFTRGLSRCVTPEYIHFAKKLIETTDGGDKMVKQEFLRRFDFDMSHWPHDFSATRPASFGNIFTPDKIQFYQWPFYHFIAHWIGKPVAFPGATYLINLMLRPHLNQGRTNLIATHPIVRTKIRAADGNFIDTVYVDKRVITGEKGKKLVITCEGNAGFYEVGCFEVPLNASYSVLGWNHPGFGYSTGIPFDRADATAIEAVYQFATESLGFDPSDIIVYGWSIGGYATSYIAMSHPDIGGIILDATFDDIIPLAIPRMPDFLGSATVKCCHNYFNLHNAQLLTKYPGPVRIIRRSSDEIISTGNPSPKFNRGNDLLLSLLSTRYPTLFTPHVIDTTLQWFLKVDPASRRHSLAEFDVEFCKQQVQLLSGPPPYELLGEGFSDSEKVMMAYYLFSKYFTDCPGGHNNPLPQKYFLLPWSHTEVNVQRIDKEAPVYDHDGTPIVSYAEDKTE